MRKEDKGGGGMTYIEAWNLISPCIANELITTKEGAEAYVMLFNALKTMDEEK